VIIPPAEYYPLSLIRASMMRDARCKPNRSHFAMMARILLGLLVAFSAPPHKQKVFATSVTP
jgi:hypothetical protein